MLGQDYTDTYSPVAKFTSIWTLLAITAQLGLKVRQMDVDTAFLNAPLYEDIWVKVPDGAPSANGDTGVYKLRKAMYGLKQVEIETDSDDDKTEPRMYGGTDTKPQDENVDRSELDDDSSEDL